MTKLYITGRKFILHLIIYKITRGMIFQYIILSIYTTIQPTQTSSLFCLSVIGKNSNDKLCFSLAKNVLSPNVVLTTLGQYCLVSFLNILVLH